jgi:glycosyltransferase involved in cell wall biosynthesis
VKVAIVHEWLVTYAGSERVLEQILQCFPTADLYCVLDFLPDAERGFLAGRSVRTTFIQKLPLARRRYRVYLPLMTLAIEQLDLSAYDLVISNSHAVAKGIIVGPDQLHICVCHSPIRYAWDLQHQYLNEGNLRTGIKSWVARWVLHKVRMWDIRAAAGVDKFIAISHFIARRIEKTYRRESVVIYPPVDVVAFGERRQKEEFYLAVSRMVPYKRMPMIIEAFAAMPEKRLVVIGDGPEFERCKELAPANVQVLAWQPFEALRDYMQRASAFIFAAEEDFGITPLEAQACGTPVIAFGKGAVLETIRPQHMDRPTGLFFAEQTPRAVMDAVQRFEEQRQRFSSAACRENAMRFAPERFRAEFMELVCQEYECFMEAKAASVALAHRKVNVQALRVTRAEHHTDRSEQDVNI